MVVANVQLFEMDEISYRRWQEAQLIVPCMLAAVSQASHTEAEERQVADLKESGWEAEVSLRVGWHNAHLVNRFWLRLRSMLGCVRDNATAPVLLRANRRPTEEFWRAPSPWPIRGAGSNGPRELLGLSWLAPFNREKKAADAGADCVRANDRSPKRAS